MTCLRNVFFNVESFESIRRTCTQSIGIEFRHSMTKCKLGAYPLRCSTMTSSNGNIFLVNGCLCGEFTGHRCVPFTKASDAELWCYLWSVLEQTVEQTIETHVIWDANELIITSLQWPPLELCNSVHVRIPIKKGFHIERKCVVSANLTK